MFLDNGWVEDIGTWLLGLGMGAIWTKRKVIRPAEIRHAELLARHEDHTKHLQEIRDKVS